MPTIATDFVPAALDAKSFENVEAYFKKLLERPVGSAGGVGKWLGGGGEVSSAGELEKWLVDRSELSAACAEARADLYISMSCDTENREAQAAYGRYIEE